MNSSTSEQKRVEAERTDRGVLCAKCEHLNAWGRTACTVCATELFLSCADCGERNERVRTQCTRCHRPLQHSIFEQARLLFTRGALQLDRLHIVLFCVGVGLAFFLVFLFSRLQMPGLF